MKDKSRKGPSVLIDPGVRGFRVPQGWLNGFCRRCVALPNGLTALLAGLMALLVSGGCRPQPRAASADGHDRVVVQLNWFAESEHGGVYQAAADGSYAAAGLEVEIRPGGAGTPVAAEVALGRADFAITNADDVVLYRAAGTDIVALVAAMQNHPRCLLVRDDSPVRSLDDLNGITLHCEPKRGFVEYLRHLGKLTGVREVPYQGSVTPLVNDPQAAIQAYVTAEPFVAQGQGIAVRWMMISDLGWNPYSSVLVTRGELIRNDPELVQRMVTATRLGWQHYLTDPQLGNRDILAANQHGMTAEALEFGGNQLKQLAVPADSDLESLGTMTAQRWETLVQQMEQTGLIAAGSVQAAECFDLQFLASGDATTTLNGEATNGPANEPASNASAIGAAAGDAADGANANKTSVNKTSVRRGDAAVTEQAAAGSAA